MTTGDDQHAIRLVEVGYDLGSSTPEWIQSIADSAGPLLDEGLGTWAVTFSFEGGRPLLGDAACAGACVGEVDFFRHAHDAAVPHDILCNGAVRTLSGACGRRRTIAIARRGGVTQKMGCIDSIALGVTDPAGFGIAVGAPLARFAELSRARHDRLARVAAHLHTALRARRRREESDEAVLAPNGRVLHAEAEARSSKAREALRLAARAIDRAKRHTGSADALEAWRAMVAGRWTLVERFEADGRRFLVARPNSPRPKAYVGLSSAETTCALYASMGHSGKLIAYELGIGESTVSAHIHSALRKLGLRSRAQLASALHLGS
ncbi:MAG: LuxR C-terminal-related transcriptional regulator [Sandaracinaceae bacterium]|nr:LuxR C-terminal-related transcriptional regulator [Sandaracinaceae bacterium]